VDRQDEDRECTAHASAGRPRHATVTSLITWKR
jgi:hypothetical protein